MIETRAKTVAERQREFRARQEERQMEFNRQATAGRAVVYALERCAEQGLRVEFKPAELLAGKETIEDKLTALANVLLSIATPIKPKENRARKTATNGTHKRVPASTVQETGKHKSRNSATVKAMRLYAKSQDGTASPRLIGE